MNIPFDLAPTDRLPGLHMLGNVVRRFLISYPVQPDLLAGYLPPGAQLALHDGFAWVSDCFVQMDNMRPNIFPGFVAMGYNYLIHRTRIRLMFPDGKPREAVLVLQPNINRQILSTFGSLLTGVQFQTRQINFTQDRDHWRIQMTHRGELLYDAQILKSSCSESIASNSRFSTAQKADDFLLGVSFGGQWIKGQHKMKLLPETHDPWTTLTCSCITHKNQFLESLGPQAPVAADHAITMTQIPHYFGITPIQIGVKG